MKMVSMAKISNGVGDAAAASQTLSRGIQVLEILAAAPQPLSIDELTHQLSVHRSIAYRLIRTLEMHNLLTRDVAGRIQLGSGLAALAAGVARDLQAEAMPELTTAANELGMTCFLTVLERDECVTLLSVEPRHAMGTVAQRPGTRHPITLGAPGKAILSQLPTEAWPPGVDTALVQQIHQAAERQWAESQDEVIPSLHAVAVPLPLRGRAPAAIAAVYLPSGTAAQSVAHRLGQSAANIRAALGG